MLLLTSPALHLSVCIIAVGTCSDSRCMEVAITV